MGLAVDVPEQYAHFKAALFQLLRMKQKHVFMQLNWFRYQKWGYRQVQNHADAIASSVSVSDSCVPVHELIPAKYSCSQI